jgi:hypothetical protein
VVTGTVNGGDTINYTQQLLPLQFSNVGHYSAVTLGFNLNYKLFQLMVFQAAPKSIVVTVIADGKSWHEEILRLLPVVGTVSMAAIPSTIPSATSSTSGQYPIDVDF